MPVDAPITATGLFRNEFVAIGLEAQSTAFLSTPGIDELYSGVANRTPSAPAIASRSRDTAAGAGSWSSSSSYGGTALRPSQRSISTSSPTSSAAARSSFVLYESPRTLPEMARIFIALRRLEELKLGDELDLVREGRLAGRERVVPVDPERGAVDRSLELEAEALVPVGIGDRVADRARELDRMGLALDRDLAVDGDLVAGALD